MPFSFLKLHYLLTAVRSRKMHKNEYDKTVDDLFLPAFFPTQVKFDPEIAFVALTELTGVLTGVPVNIYVLIARAAEEAAKEGAMNATRNLQNLGQSLRFDEISRGLPTGGTRPQRPSCTGTGARDPDAPGTLSAEVWAAEHQDEGARSSDKSWNDRSDPFASNGAGRGGDSSRKAAP